MQTMRRTTVLVITIILMIAAIAASSAWIYKRGVALKTAREKEQEIREAEEQEAAREAARKEAEDKAVTSHIFSHRGSAGPEEHSFKAYDDAINAGSRYIEQDLVLSSDGVLYVSHDLSANAMTGTNALYDSLSSAVIDELTTYEGNKILRLSDVFDRYGTDINYVIELKDSKAQTIDAFEDIVDSYGYIDNIIVQCMDSDVLKTLDDKYPDMPKLFVCRSQWEFNNSLEMPYVDIISVKASVGLMTQENCDAAHESGKLFGAWTLDSETEIMNAINIGVDNYFTNDTPLAISLEREYGLNVRKDTIDGD